MAFNYNTTEPLIANTTIAEVLHANGEGGLESDNAPYSPLLTVLRTLFVAFICALVVTSNIFSLIVMRFVDSPRFPPCTKVFLCYVILTDLAYGVGSTPFIGPAALNYWPYGEFLCEASNVVLGWICACCGSAAVLITLDRLLAVLYPLRHVNIMPRRRAIIIVSAVTIISLLPSICNQGLMGVEIAYNNNAMKCFTKWSNGSKAYLPYLILKCCYTAFIPMAFMIGSYAKLYLVARKHTVRHAKLQIGRNSNSVRQTNIRALKMCFLITGTFCITWIPYTIVSISEYIKNREAPAFLVFVTSWSCLCNSWLDVIIYFFMAREFRRTALKLVCRRRSKNQFAKQQHTK